MPDHNVIIFPMHVALLSGVESIGIGPRGAWVYPRTGAAIRVRRRDFPIAMLSATGTNGGMELAIHARKLADAQGITS